MMPEALICLMVYRNGWQQGERSSAAEIREDVIGRLDGMKRME